MRTIGMERQFLKLHRHRCLEYSAIIRLKDGGLWCGENFLVRLAQNRCPVEMKAVFKLTIHEHVSPFRVLQEDHVGTIIQDGQKQELARGELVLHLFALRHVLNLTNEIERLTGWVTDQGDA